MTEMTDADVNALWCENVGFPAKSIVEASDCGHASFTASSWRLRTHQQVLAGPGGHPGIGVSGGNSEVRGHHSHLYGRFLDA